MVISSCVKLLNSKSTSKRTVTSLIYTKRSLLKVLPYDRSFKEVKQTVLLKQFSVMK